MTAANTLLAVTDNTNAYGHCLTNLLFWNYSRLSWVPKPLKFLRTAAVVCLQLTFLLPQSTEDLHIQAGRRHGLLASMSLCK